MDRTVHLGINIPENWDCIDINNPNMTLNEFLEHIEAQYHCEVQMLSQGVTILHSFFFSTKQSEWKKSNEIGRRRGTILIEKTIDAER